MAEMISFLRAIAESPDDDATRLMFSDWLDDHGHHQRAEFIRLQVELARMDPGEDGYAEKTARMRRCGMFTRKGKVPFFDHLPTGGCKIAFHRGLIESIDTAEADSIDTSGLDLVPVQALRTGDKWIGQLKGLTKLKRLEYHGSDASPARLLEIFGPEGWFNNLEELCLPGLNRACLEAGVIPQFELPRLRNFFLSTDAFYNLEAAAAGGGGPDGSDGDYGRRPWGGLPEYLPRNAIPSPKSPLERFVWHSEDDCDFFNDEDWYWRGPTMESLLAHLKGHRLKQVEVVVDYDDHEGGTEGVIAAPYRQSPLALSPTLERVTLDEGDLRLLDGSPQKLKGLRVYGFEGFDEALFALLRQPVCSELESLHVEARAGWWGSERVPGPSIEFPKLKSLYTSGGALGDFSSCRFPGLVSLEGHSDLKSILQRKWPNLQRLRVDVGAPSDLAAFSQSDCCPNLTTLTIGGYFDPTKADFSFLAKCPHMPNLSLIRFPDYPMDRTYVVDGGKLLPVRGDITPDEQTPTTLYRIAAVF